MADTQNALQLVAQELTNRNLFLNVYDQSIFKAIDQSNSDTNIICKQLANKINNELILVKNKLRPLMNDLAAEIEKTLSNTDIESEISKYSIETVDVPGLVNELELLGLIGKAREPRSIGVSSVSIKIPAKEDIKKYFVHPNSAANVSVAQLLSKYTDDDLINLWDKYLTSVSATNSNIKELGFNAQERVSELLLLQTVISNLVKDNDDTKEVEMLQLLQGEVANVLAIVKEKILASRAGGVLVIKVEDKKAKVDAELYNKFISEGNTPEVILGYIVKGQHDVGSSIYNNVIANKEEYLSLWNAKVQLAAFQESNNNMKRYKTVYDIVLGNLYKEGLPKDLQELATPDYGSAKARLDQLFTTYKPEEVLDYNLVARDIVGEVLFPETNFSHFARSITSFSKLNPNITAQDAATSASLDFIIDFLLQQVYVGDINGDPANK